MIHVITAPELRCEVAAGAGALGGRILSLRSKDGHEWLAPSTPPPAHPGAAFVRPGMGGWDEVVPSVQADLLEDGTRVPDHGDVWNAPWAVVSSSASELVMEVQLSSVPVALERTIAATATGLRLSYRATTASTVPIPLLWCAHPQFLVGAGAAVRVELAGEPVSPTLIEMPPTVGRTRVFPVPPLHESLPRGGSVKAFVEPGTRADAAIITLASGRSLRLSWDAAELPYLGLFWDNGECAPDPVLAIEPSTGWGDLLSDAIRRGRVRSVEKAAPLEWWVELSA